MNSAQRRKNHREWTRTRAEIPGLTLEDRDFARLVALTVINMNAWKLNVLGGKSIYWKKLPMTVSVRPEWDILIQRYGFQPTFDYNYSGMKPFHGLVLKEAHRILQIPREKQNA